MTSAFFVFRVALAWLVPAVIFVSIFASIAPRAPRFLFPLIIFATLVVAVVRGFSHMRRVRLIAERLDSAALGNRHRRQIELPFPAEDAFSMVDAAIRKAHPDLEARIAGGDLAPAFDWLEANIWTQGRRWETAELARRATGEALNPAHFRRHLEARYL